MTELSERILARCQPEGDCLVWQGGKTADGYGVIRIPGSRRHAYVHRIIYEERIGPIPKGLTIDHVAARGCRSKACCNPDHLEAVTRGENMRRARRKLSDEQIAEIRASSEPVPALALRFGVSKSCVQHTRSGYSWAEAA